MSANPQRPLYDFYFRYKWGHQDFANLQSALVGLQRDMLGALAGPSLLNGGAIAPSGATRAVTIAPYIAINADGYLNVVNTTTLASIAANASGNPRKDLIVARPNLVNGTIIARPTSPFDSVPLTVLQESQVVVITGTPAGSPAYPAKVAGDVILGGLAVANGATSFSAGNIDTTVTELISTNTNFANWVVGKDTHGTAALTADSGATRAALVATGGNSQPGISASSPDLSGTAISAVGGVAGVGVAGTVSGTGGGVGVQGSINELGAGVKGLIVATGSNAGIGVSGEASGSTSGNSIGVLGVISQATGASSCGVDARSLGDSRALIVEPKTSSPTKAAMRIVPGSQPSGPNLIGDMYMTTAGVLMVCTVAGSPGTWAACN